MKIVSHYLQSIEGVEIYPIISLVIFFVFFTLVIVHTFSIKKTDLKKLSDIPLEDNNNNDELIERNN